MNENRTASRLKVERLRKKYKSRVVVKDVSFEVGSGEVIGLLGPNGAGKTTCFYMIVGLVSADGGDIHLNGERLTHLPIHRRAHQGLSYLPQENSVFRKLDVEQNIMAILELNERDPQVRERRLDELLEELGITHLRKSAAVSLSGGERRRVEIARALATSPRFILLDEPFAGVDAATERAILDVLLRTKATGRTLVVVHHDLATAAEYFDTLVLVKQRIYACGSPRAVLHPDLLSEVYEGRLHVFAQFDDAPTGESPADDLPVAQAPADAAGGVS